METAWRQRSFICFHLQNVLKNTPEGLCSPSKMFSEFFNVIILELGVRSHIGNVVGQMTILVRVAPVISFKEKNMLTPDVSRRLLK